MKKFVRSIFLLFGLGLVRSRRLDQLIKIEAECDDLFGIIASHHGIANKSKSQLWQDIFVLIETKFKKNGFFVEFGATNGIDLSNTYLLEKDFGWNGILAEPANVWQQDLKKNRSAYIETECVWSESGKTLSFNMVKNAEFSTLNDFNNRDQHYRIREDGILYNVTTISLRDLLKKYITCRLTLRVVSMKY